MGSSFSQVIRLPGGYQVTYDLTNQPINLPRKLANRMVAAQRRMFILRPGSPILLDC